MIARPPAHRQGSVLILVLWMLIILGVLGLAYSSSVRTQLQVSGLRQGRTQAYWAARAGVEMARARLAQIDPAGLAASDPIFDDEEEFARHRVGTASFTLLAPPLEEDGELKFGLQDEGARLNVNAASEEMLLALPGMTREMAHGLIDWRDGDQEPMPAGAESDYYQSLPDPYSAKNAPLATLRELLRVSGWREVTRAAWPDPFEKFSRNQDDSRPSLDPAQARYMMNLMTVHSADMHLAPDGEQKMNLASVEAAEIRQRIPSLSEDDAQAIVKHRDKGSYNSPLDLLSVTKPQQNNNNGMPGEMPAGMPGGQPPQMGGAGMPGGGMFGAQGFQPGQGQPAPPVPQGQQAPQNDSTPIFDLKRTGEIIDYFMTAQNADAPGQGQINLNTAPLDVLLCLPQSGQAMAQAIIEQRQSEQGLKQAGSIASLDGMTEDKFRAIYPWVTVNAHRFGVTSQGTEEGSSAMVTIHAVLSLETNKTVTIIDWRED